jgi:hypothetical protein
MGLEITTWRVWGKGIKGAWKANKKRAKKKQGQYEALRDTWRSMYYNTTILYSLASSQNCEINLLQDAKPVNFLIYAGLARKWKLNRLKQFELRLQYYLLTLFPINMMKFEDLIFGGNFPDLSRFSVVVFLWMCLLLKLLHIWYIPTKIQLTSHTWINSLKSPIKYDYNTN